MAAPGVSPGLAPAPQPLAPGRAGTAVLARRLVGLKARLLLNTLTRSTWVLVGTVLGAVSDTYQDLFGEGSFIGKGIYEVDAFEQALGLPRADATLDPARLALFPLTVGQLQWGQALGAFVGVPGTLTTVALLGTLASWRSSPAALAAAVLCLPLALALLITGSRCVTALAIGLGRRRRVTELVSLVALLGLVLLGPILTGLMSGLELLWDRLPGYADVLARTPLTSRPGAGPPPPRAWPGPS